MGEKVAIVSNSKKAESPTSEKTLCHVPETDAVKKNTMANDAVKKNTMVNDVPKRRKVVKTRIDERGREGISTTFTLIILFH